MKKLIIVIILLAFCETMFSQSLIQSRKTSYYSKFYKLTNEQAKHICKKGVYTIDDKYLSQLVDSLPTDSSNIQNLDYGNYLKVWTESDKMFYQTVSIQNFYVEILNNDADLCVKVFDNLSNTISDAKVKIGKQTIKYDKKTQTYRIKKSNKKGVLTVQYNSNTLFFNIERQINNPLVYRFEKKIIYSYTFKIIIFPIKIIIFPFKLVKNIVFFPRRTFRNLNYFCQDIFENRKQYSGYMVFNQPKYKSGDTVKLKAFIIDKKGKPVNKTLNLVLRQDYSKEIKLAQIKPYRKGAYSYEFVLDDSLNLTLDKTQTVYLEKEKYNALMLNSFYYEDYELKATKLEFNIPNTEQFKNQNFEISFRATNENNLNLLDAKLNIVLVSSPALQIFGNYCFIPDTLLKQNIELQTQGETKFVVPDSIFPNANFVYTIKAELKTSDNEIVKQSKIVSYYLNKQDIEYNLSNDSIEFFYKYNNVKTTNNFNLIGYDKFSKPISIQIVELPYKTQINNIIKNYKLWNDSFNITKQLSETDANLNCLTFRTKDSIFVNIQNPHNIPFNYFIYSANKEITRGFAKILDYKNKANPKNIYNIYLEYLWAGRIIEKSYQIDLYENILNIDVKQPKLVFPGQETEIEITVTDYDNKPVENVDLTAYSLTKKFNYSSPTLQFFYKKHKSKKFINTFELNNYLISPNKNYNQLDFQTFKNKFGLDSVEYYKFLYPDSFIYTTICNSENNITQFSPFVVKNGIIQPIYIIYLDQVPVYMSWNTTQNPYSFPVTVGYHTIELRLVDRKIILKNFKFEDKKKTIFSIELDKYNENKDAKYKYKNNELLYIEEVKMPKKPSEYEIKNLSNYVFYYRNNFSNYYSYIEQYDKVALLNPSSNSYSYYNYYYNTNMVCPVKQQNTVLNVLGNESQNTDFQFEPNFEYEFQYPKIKMRTADSKYYLKDFKYTNNNSIADKILSKNDILNLWQQHIYQLRLNGTNLSYYNNNYGFKPNLVLKYIPKDKPLNIILLNYYTQTSNIYTGNVTNFYNLNKSEYKAIFLFKDAKYFIVDSIFIKQKGINYYNINAPKAFLKDSISVYLDSILNLNCINQNIKLDKLVSEIIFQNLEYKYLKGYVYDEFNKPLSGVKIESSLTNKQFFTDQNGHFNVETLKNEELTFSYEGCNNFVLTKQNSEIIDIYLTYKTKNITEYIGEKNTITGYVYDEYGEAIPGASIRLKDYSDIGTITDLDGKYVLTNIPLDSKYIVVSFVGMETITSAIIFGQINSTTLYSSDLMMEDVVVTAMLKQSKKKIAYAAQEISGEELSRDDFEIAKESDIPFEYVGGITNFIEHNLNPDYIFINDNIQQNIKGAVYDDEFFQSAMSESNIRNNFSDYAFWQPQLFTDANGKAKFKVKFPDDVTSWRTYILAMNDQKQSGQTEGNINAYKPLMSQLSLPNFMLVGDTCGAIGKSLNYTENVYNITTNFAVNDSNIWQKQNSCKDAVIDTLMFTAKSTDSLKLKYYLQTEDGYFDGEERKIKTYPLGVELAEGKFWSFDKDTVFNLDLSQFDGEVEFTAFADVFDVFLYETQNIINYNYLCNEQLASKLLALLTEKTIKEFKNIKFKKDDDIRKIIKKLEQNQNQEGLWGWWDKNNTAMWLSFHVIRALDKVEKAGYEVNINFEDIKSKLIVILESNLQYYYTPEILKYLKNNGVETIDYKKYITNYENSLSYSLTEKFNIIELKQICGIDIKLDSVFKFMQSTLYGNIYFTPYPDQIYDNYMIYENRTTLTLSAYRILKNANYNEDTLSKIRNYFFEKNDNSYWANTYEAALIIETILPEYLNKNNKLGESELTFTGAINQKVTKFPFITTIKSGENLVMEKTGIFPTYISVYKRYWQTEPTENSEYFDIETSFTNNADNLKAGEVVKLKTTVTVKKDAEYVMIEIPIPAGCSYTNKPNNFENEVHREYFENKTSIFCEKLNKGKYSFEIELTPRYTGVYSLNPAKAELMYFPIFYGNNEIKKVRIND